MDHDELRRFNDFRRTDRDGLMTILQHARELLLPAGRRLLAPGRRLHGRYYLLDGAVRTSHPDAQFSARDARARESLYPGARSITTCLPSRVVHIDWDRVSFLLTVRSMLATPELRETWETRFLGSPMMQLLPTRDWQCLLAELLPKGMSRGSDVIREGSLAQGCFVLAEGHAVVHRGRRTLAYLVPGDFFGEDAIVTGRARNASVTMLENGAVLELSAPVFRSLLLKSVVPLVKHAGAGGLINVGQQQVEAAINVTPANVRNRVRMLDRNLPYYVVGGDEADRALTALLLIQAGVRAAVVTG